MKIPNIEKINNRALLHAASKLKPQGVLLISPNYLVYLDVVDDYIHQLFPLINLPHISKPNYFGPRSIGAHITTIYPEENVKIDKKDLGQQHHFIITEFVKTRLAQKEYYILLVKAPTLTTIRKKYNMTDKLDFKGYAIDLHITIAVRSLK